MHITSCGTISPPPKCLSYRSLTTTTLSLQSTLHPRPAVNYEMPINHITEESSAGAPSKADKRCAPSALTLNALAPPAFSMTNTTVQKTAGPAPGIANLCHPNMNGKFTTKAAKKPIVQGPSAWRQLLPIAACILSFATVLSVLIVYMDTTAIRHQQFRLNMSRDYEMYGVRQDDPTLLTFIREIHMKKYPMPFMKNAHVEPTNFADRHDLAPQLARYVSGLVGGKQNGVFVQSLPAASASMSTAPWLSQTLGWGGIIVEPEPRNYFELRKQNAQRPNVQIAHACLSTSDYPKEVTLHHEDENDVRINSLMDEESWFNSRVKCFPLYTLMLAVNHTNIDLLSLGCQGDELKILGTVPFQRVLIRVISITLQDMFRHDSSAAESYAQNVTRFLQTKSYRLVKVLEHNYIYQLNNRALRLSH